MKKPMKKAAKKQATAKKTVKPKWKTVSKTKQPVPVKKQLLAKATMSRKGAVPIPSQYPKTSVPSNVPNPKQSSQREGTGFKVAMDKIEGEATIGEVLVVFPRTREVFLKHGLKLDVDEAGDIYMTLDAFAVIHGVRTEMLIRELIEASRQPPPQSVQPMAQAAAPQTATP